MTLYVQTKTTERQVHSTSKVLLLPIPQTQPTFASLVPSMFNAMLKSVTCDLSDALSVIKTDMAVGIVRVRSLKKITLVKRHVLDLLAASPELKRCTYVEYSSTVACIFLEGSLTRRKRVIRELMIGKLHHLVCLPAPVTGI